MTSVIEAFHTLDVQKVFDSQGETTKAFFLQAFHAQLDGFQNGLGMIPPRSELKDPTRHMGHITGQPLFQAHVENSEAIIREYSISITQAAHIITIAQIGQFETVRIEPVNPTRSTLLLMISRLRSMDDSQLQVSVPLFGEYIFIEGFVNVRGKFVPRHTAYFPRNRITANRFLTRIIVERYADNGGINGVSAISPTDEMIQSATRGRKKIQSTLPLVEKVDAAIRTTY